MYRIIGADGKEYGPVTGDQMRQWIAEGRVNARTRARAEGAPDWQPLIQFPEFADVAGVSAAGAPAGALPPMMGAVGFGREAAVQAARAPAIALMVTSILNLLVGIFAVSFMRRAEEFYAGMPEFKEPEMQRSLHLMFGPTTTAAFVLGIVMSVVILIGAMRMQALKNYAFAFTVGILAMIPCVTPCCLIGLPFGIWALAVLSRPDVKSQFG
jgi:hypothetical protein